MLFSADYAKRKVVNTSFETKPSATVNGGVRDPFQSRAVCAAGERVTSVSGRRRWAIRLRWWTWAHRAVAAGFLTLMVLSWWLRQDWLRGSPTGTRLLDCVAFVDPLAAAEVLVAAHQVTGTMVLGAAVPLVLTLLLGRFFCGWLCPLGLILELAGELRERLRRLLIRCGVCLPRQRRVALAERATRAGGSADKATASGASVRGHSSTRPVRSLPRSFKYWLLSVCIGMSAVASVPVFTAFSPINMVVLGIMGLSTTAVVVVAVICLVELFVPRIFCRAVCPLGALYSLLGRAAPLRVRVRAGGEKLSCAQCTMRCPMGIRVMEDYVLAGRDSVTDPECTRCGTCADVCQGRVLGLGVRRRKCS